MIKDGNTYRIISDHLGSVRLVVNTSTGAIAQRIDYNEYGVELNNTNLDFQPFHCCRGPLLDNNADNCYFEVTKTTVK